jgi:hypothetical protein
VAFAAMLKLDTGENTARIDGERAVTFGWSANQRQASPPLAFRLNYISQSIHETFRIIPIAPQLMTAKLIIHVRTYRQSVFTRSCWTIVIAMLLPFSKPLSQQAVLREKTLGLDIQPYDYKRDQSNQPLQRIWQQSSPYNAAISEPFIHYSESVPVLEERQYRKRNKKTMHIWQAGINSRLILHITLVSPEKVHSIINRLSSLRSLSCGGVPKNPTLTTRLDGIQSPQELSKQAIIFRRRILSTRQRNANCRRREGWVVRVDTETQIPNYRKVAEEMPLDTEDPILISTAMFECKQKVR